jgi:hypothetical protein
MQTMLYPANASVQFYRRGTKPEEGYWYITNDDISEAGPSNQEGGVEFYRHRTVDSFIKFASDNDPIAIVNLDASIGSDEKFEDWEHLARYMGITDLVVLSTKVPKRIAEKFQYYATQETTVSSKLRELVYGFVVSSIKENAENDAFR